MTTKKVNTKRLHSKSIKLNKKVTQNIIKEVKNGLLIGLLIFLTIMLVPFIITAEKSHFLKGFKEWAKPTPSPSPFVLQLLSPSPSPSPSPTPSPSLSPSPSPSSSPQAVIQEDDNSKQEALKLINEKINSINQTINSYNSMINNLLEEEKQCETVGSSLTDPYAQAQAQYRCSQTIFSNINQISAMQAPFIKEKNELERQKITILSQ